MGLFSPLTTTKLSASKSFLVRAEAPYNDGAMASAKISENS